MKVLALVSGGKDSCMSMVECVRNGHEIIALANLFPKEGLEELDSHMFQTVGVRAICPAIAECMGVPLFKREIKGASLQTEMQYQPGDQGDEVEDLFFLVKQAKEAMPEIEAVCSGAVLSNYQRLRVESVCERLGLTSLAFLWQRNQSDLLKNMIDLNLTAMVIKIASIGLKPSMLGKSISELQATFEELHQQYGFHVCGEGGEYETITLDCSLFKERRILIDSFRTVVVDDNPFAPVAHLVIEGVHTEQKATETLETLESIVIGEENCQVERREEEVNLAPVIPIKHRLFEGIFPPDIVKVCQTGALISVNGCTCTGKPSLEQEVTGALEALQTNLQENGMDICNVVFVHLFISEMSMFKEVNTWYSNFFNQHLSNSPPSRACVEIGMGDTGCHVLVNAIASQSTKSVLHVRSISKWAPVCIGPYAQSNYLSKLGFCFVAGQIALDPVTMDMSTECKTPISQLQLAFQHCESILSAQGLSLPNTVRMTVYISSGVRLTTKDVEEHFPSQNVPPLTILRVPRLPRDALVEVEVLAFKAGAGLENTIPLLQPPRCFGTDTIGVHIRSNLTQIGDHIGAVVITLHSSTTLDKVLYDQLFDRVCVDIVDAVSKHGFEPTSAISNIAYCAGLSLAHGLALKVAEEFGVNPLPVDEIITGDTEKALLSINMIHTKFPRLAVDE